MGIVARVEAPEPAQGVIDDLVLARIAAERGATRSELLRDLGPLASHRLAPSELRREVDGALRLWDERGAINATRGRYHLSEDGEACALAILECKALPREWSDIRDVRLVGVALGIAGQSEARTKSLARPDGLRAAILQRAYNLPGRRVPSTAKLRCALAVVALERAFGNKIKGGFDSGKALSAKAGRMLAGQLSRRPRDFGTDARLIAALAAEACGSAQTDAGALRLAILRNAVSHRGAGQLELVVDRDRDAAAGKPRGREKPPPGRPAAANRPDLPGFAAIVLRFAEEHGEGWPGNKKAFISKVWCAVSEAHPDWGLSEVEFKAMLTEAHRTGHLVLANADLKSKANADLLQASAVSYKNTVWHYVRAAD